MSCKYYNKICARCKKSDDYLVFDKQDLNDVSLENYKSFINFDIEVCPYCGYISTDVEQGYTNESESVINSEKYNDILTYSYLDGIIDELNDNFLNSYPANLFECYAMLNEHTKDYESAIKGYFRAIILKETIIKRYNQQKNEDYEDLSKSEIKAYDKINNILLDSIKQNTLKILDIYKLCKNNIYLDLINIECLTRLGLDDDANNCFNAIKSNLPNDIINYIENL